MLKRTVVSAPYLCLFDKWVSASGYETPKDGPTGSLNISVGAKILYAGGAGMQGQITNPTGG